MDGGNCTKSPYSSSSNNQQGQNMNPKNTFEEAEVTNSSLTNNTGCPPTNMNNSNQQQQQDFNLDDLNFDPAALIGGNGENTDLNVSQIKKFGRKNRYGQQI